MYLCMLKDMKFFRAILFIVNALLALALVLTTMAGTVAPSRCILPSLLAFGYVPLLLANVAMILVWAVMGRWELLLSVIAIAVRWTMVPLLLQVGGTSKVPPVEEHPERVTLMTYNVHQFRGNGAADSEGSDTGGTLSVSADSIAIRFIGLVRSEAPDVLCLQEYAAVRGVNVTDSLATMGYNHYYGAHTATAGTPYGTTVFSRLPVTFVKRLDSDKVLVELMSEGRRLRVVCLHMESYRFDDVDLDAIDHMRRDDTRTLDKVKNTILAHEKEWTTTVGPALDGSTTPTVVAGDMNDIPWSWLYHQMSHRLTDTFTECGNGTSATYRLDLPDAMPMTLRIDMVFRSEGLRTLSYKRIKTPLSDHYPILVSLEFTI